MQTSNASTKMYHPFIVFHQRLFRSKPLGGFGGVVLGVPGLVSDGDRVY